MSEEEGWIVCTISMCHSVLETELLVLFEKGPHPNTPSSPVCRKHVYKKKYTLVQKKQRTNKERLRKIEWGLASWLVAVFTFADQSSRSGKMINSLGSAIFCQTPVLRIPCA